MDTLRYHWHNLNQQITKIVSELILVQDDFRTTLLGNVEQFIEDSSVFVTDYTEVYLPVLYCPLLSYTLFSSERTYGYRDTPSRGIRSANYLPGIITYLIIILLIMCNIL